MLNYIICYAPGSSGRFITSVIYRIANNIDEHLLITKENSGHLEHKNGIIPGFHPVAYNNHPLIFKQLSPLKFYPDNIIATFSTHAYPKVNMIKDNHELVETRFIVILYDEDDWGELTANFTIKSVYERLVEILNSDKDISEFVDKVYYYTPIFVMNEFIKIYNYELTRDNLFDTKTIENVYEILVDRKISRSQERPNYIFPGTPLLNELDNRMLKIRYKDIFKKTENSYVALEQIGNFLEAPVPLKIFESYEKYVTDQQLMLNTYFPWLTNSIDN